MSIYYVLSTWFSQAVFIENRGVRQDCHKADAEWMNKTSLIKKKKKKKKKLPL